MEGRSKKLSHTKPSVPVRRDQTISCERKDRDICSSQQGHTVILMCLPQNQKMFDPILLTLLKMRPHYSQSSRENATPSTDTSALASWATVSVPECNHAEKSHTCQFFRCFCLPYLQDQGLLGSTNFAKLAR